MAHTHHHSPPSFPAVSPPTSKISLAGMHSGKIDNKCAANLSATACASIYHPAPPVLASSKCLCAVHHHTESHKHPIAPNYPSASRPAVPSRYQASVTTPTFMPCGSVSCCHDNCLRRLAACLAALKHAVSRAGRCSEPLGNSVCACLSPIGWAATPPNVGY